MPFARLTPFPFHKYLIPSFLITALKELCGINEFCLCILHNSTGAEVVLEIIEAILEIKKVSKKEVIVDLYKDIFLNLLQKIQ